MKDLKQKTFKAFAWNLGGKLADQGIGFFISIILARLLAPEEFGLLAMAAVLISMAQILVESGLNTALVQKQDLTKYDYGTVFTFNITVGSLLAISFFLLAGVFAKFYENEELIPVIQLLSLNFIINSFALVQKAWLQKQLKFDTISKAEIGSVISGGAIGVLMAFSGFGVWALVAQTLVSGLFRNLYISLSTNWKPAFLFSWKSLRNLWEFSGNLIYVRVINTITEQIDKLIIGKLFSPSTLGFYYRAKSFNLFINKYTSGTLMNVLFPALSNIQNENERYLEVINKAILGLGFIVFFIVGFLFVNAESIIVLLFSEKWLPSVQFFQILMMSGFVHPISSLLVSILISKGNSKKNLKLGLIKQTLIITNLIVGFYFGLIEYLYGYVFVLNIALFINFKFAADELNVKISWFLLRIYKPFIAFLLATLITYISVDYFSCYNYFVTFLVASVIYLLVFLCINIIVRNSGMFLIISEIKSTLKNVWNKK